MVRVTVHESSREGERSVSETGCFCLLCAFCVISLSIVVSRVAIAAWPMPRPSAENLRQMAAKHSALAEERASVTDILSGKGQIPLRAGSRAGLWPASELVNTSPTFHRLWVFMKCRIFNEKKPAEFRKTPRICEINYVDVGLRPRRQQKTTVYGLFCQKTDLRTVHTVFEPLIFCL